jgi:anti-sigma-K factor RskA
VSALDEQFECTESVDAAPYVLGALADPDAYSAHLATCSICQAEVARLQPVADALPSTVPPAPAPESLRQRVLATVRSEAELLHAAAGRTETPGRAAGWLRPRRFSLASGLAAAAAVAVAVLLALDSGSSPRVRVSTAQVSVRGAAASLRELGDRSELIVSGMPQPAPGSIYEVWLRRGASALQPTDALFGVTSRGSSSVDIPGSLRGVQEVLVTSEPLGGSAHPTSPPLIRVAVKA